MKVKKGARFKFGSPGNLRMLISKGESKKMLANQASQSSESQHRHSWPKGRIARWGFFSIFILLGIIRDVLKKKKLLLPPLPLWLQWASAPALWLVTMFLNSVYFHENLELSQKSLFAICFCGLTGSITPLSIASWFPKEHVLFLPGVDLDVMSAGMACR